MAIDIAIQNFRNIKEARLIDENPISIILGYNESGKSSLIGAVQYACTGTAFGRKGTSVDGLVTRGTDKMAVRLQINNILVQRTKTGGDPIKTVAGWFGVTPELLPLLFDAKMNGDGGSKAMRAFLDGAASAAFEPLNHFANDPPIHELVLKARAVGKMTTKAIIEHCETMRASCKVPAAPVMPGFARPTPEQVTQIRQQVEQAEAVLRMAMAEYTDAVLLGQKLAKLNNYKTELATYEKQRAAATVVDPLKERRQALVRVININEASIKAVIDVLTVAGFAPQGQAVSISVDHIAYAKGEAQKILAANPTPAAMPTPPLLPDDVFKLAIELGAPSTDTINAAAYFSADDLRSFLTQSATDTVDCKSHQDVANTNVRTLSTQRDELLKQVGAFEAYDRSVPLYDENKMAIEAEWQRWDTAAKTIARAEVDHVNKSGDVFGQLVSDFSASILQGRKIRISRDEGIFLGQDRIEDCSESTRWRVEVAIMAAVGVMLKSPLLMIDGADILDVQNKALVQTFLIQNIIHRFKHTIVTSTSAREIHEEQGADPSLGISVWTINHGVLKRL